jgi:cell division control protein 6
MGQQTLSDIFSGYVQKAGSIFSDRNILSHDHIPDQAVHRDEQIHQLANIIAPAIQGARPSNTFLYGKTGTGKTLVARQVTNELSRTSKNITVLYMNCKMKRVADTEYRLFAELSRELGKEVPATGLPTDEVYRIFYNAVDSKAQSLILILYEIDALVKKVGDEILYNLTRANANLKQAKLSIIGISNNVSFIDALDPRVKSSLSEEEIIFPPYNANQLKDILSERASKAFIPASLEGGVIEKCSALAAQEHGDARKALDLLRVAGEMAERKKSPKVTTSFVDMAEDKLDLDRTTEVVRSQPKQSLAVLSGILKLTDKGEKDIQTGDIYVEYEKISAKCGLKPLTQRRVSDLIAELDMLGIINAKVISKGRYGRTREIRILLTKPAVEKIRRVLEENYLL